MNRFEDFEGDGDAQGIGVPVRYLSDREPWNHPQFIPGGPHVLPGANDRPALRSFQGVAPAILPAMPTAGMGPAPDKTLDVSEAHRYATSVELPFDVGIVSGRFIDQPAGRRNFLSIRNTSTGTQALYVSFGKDASTRSIVKLVPGQMLIYDVVVPQDDVYAISDAAGCTMTLQYSTINS